MSDDFELEPCGVSAPPARARPGVPGGWRLAVVAIALAGIVLAPIAITGRDHASDARRRLDAVADFLRRPAPLRFDVDYQASEDSGDGQQVVGSTRLTGRIDGRGRAAWTETSGVGWEPHPFVEENVLVAHGLYTRRGDGPDQVAAHQWVYSDRQEFDEGLRRKRERPFAFFDAASDSPLVGALLTGDLNTVLGHLDQPALDGAGTVRANRRVTDLFPGAARNQTRLEVEVTASAAGRPRRVVVRHDLGRVGEDPDLKQTVTDIRFRWDEPVVISEVPVDEIDATPEVDEADFAVSSFAPILAPTDLPPGMLLTAARVDAVFTCNGSSFEYESAGGATLFFKQWFCPPDLTDEQWSEADGVEQPFVAGAYRGTIRRAQVGPAAGRALVRFLLAGSFIHAETDLADDTLRATFASLAPVDFTTQPVARRLPPT